MKACKLTGGGGGGGGGGNTKGSGGYSAQKLFNSSSVKSAIEVNCHSGCPGVQNVAMIQCSSCAMWFHVRQ